MVRKEARTHLATLRRTMLVSVSIFAAAAGAQNASAQSAAPTPPSRSALDQNGVNITIGQAIVSTPTISIGATNSSRLDFNQFYSGKSWTNPYSIYLSTSSSGANVTLGGGGDTFTLSGSSYVAANGNGATLVAVSGGYLYTMSDGTTINFSSSLIGGSAAYYGGGTVQAIATSMTRPNGEILTFTYKQQAMTGAIPGGGSGPMNYVRLQSVNSNLGLQIKLSYSLSFMSASTDAPTWMQLSNARALNNSADYCDPTSDSCTFSQSWPKLDFSYASSGSNTIMSVTDSMGAITAITTDSSGRPIGFRKPNDTSDTTTISYDSNGIISNMSRNGISYQYSMQPAYNLVYMSLTGPSGTIYSVTSNSVTGQVTSTADALGNTTNYGNDGYGRVTSVTYPTGNSTQYVYDGRGNVTSQTEVPKSGSGLPNITLSATYPANCTNAVSCNKPTSTTDAAGNVTNYAYDPVSGMLTSITGAADANGNHPQTRYTYSSMQAYYKNSSGSITASGTNITLLRTAASCKSNPSCAGTSDEVVQTFDYGPQTSGAANNLFPISITTAAGDNSLSATAQTAFDILGNVSTVTGPLGAAQTSRYRYDGDRRLLGVVSPDPDGSGSRTPSAVKYTYNVDGALTLTQIGTVTDQTDTAWNNFTESYRKTNVLDGYDRVKRITSWSNGIDYAVSDYLYDNNGRPFCTIQYMDPANWGPQAGSCAPLQTSGVYGPDRVTQFAYDANSRVTSVTRGVGTSSAAVAAIYSYTASGKYASVADGQSNLTSYIYDGFDRLSQTQFPNSAQSSNSSNSADFTQTTYDAYGRATQLRLRDGNLVSLSYDNLGRVVTRQPTTNLSYPFDYPVNYSYNLLGQVVQISRPGDGANIGYTFDALGRMVSESQTFGTITYAYDQASRRTRLTWTDGHYAQYDYDNTGLVTAIREDGATSGVGVLASYAYDNLGRRSSITYGNGTSRTYAYDGIGRLSGLAFSFPDSSKNQVIGKVGSTGTPIVYSPASQIISTSRSNPSYAWNGAVSASRTYATNGLNQYTNAGSTNFSYDGRGNLSASGSDTFSYTKNNELKSAPNATLYYDPLSRLHEYDTSTSTRFVYAGNQVSQEVTGSSNTLLRRYVMGPGDDEPLVWYEGSGMADRRFLQADERGSVVAASDGSGSLIAINSYDEFGIPSSGNIGRFQYTGQAYMPEIGLYNYKARFYSPTMGRFLQTDPVGYDAGLNIYNYASSDPVNKIDPTGLADIVVVAGSTGPFTTGSTHAFPAVVPMPAGATGGGNAPGVVDIIVNAKKKAFQVGVGRISFPFSALDVGDAANATPPAKSGSQSAKACPTPSAATMQKITNQALEDAGGGGTTAPYNSGFSIIEKSPDIFSPGWHQAYNSHGDLTLSWQHELGDTGYAVKVYYNDAHHDGEITVAIVDASLIGHSLDALSVISGLDSDNSRNYKLGIGYLKSTGRCGG